MTLNGPHRLATVKSHKAAVVAKDCEVVSSSDGNIIGSGNDRTTPRIMLNILGVDPKLGPELLLFKPSGEGSKQLDYDRVYSGLYEFKGNAVP